MTFEDFESLLNNIDTDNIIKIINSKYYRPLKRKEKIELRTLNDLSKSSSQNVRILHNIITKNVTNKSLQNKLIEYYLATTFKEKQKRKNLLKEIY